jgi:hypothetical protein
MSAHIPTALLPKLQDRIQLKYVYGTLIYHSLLIMLNYITDFS